MILYHSACMSAFGRLGTHCTGTSSHCFAKAGRRPRPAYLNQQRKIHLLEGDADAKRLYPLSAGEQE